MTIPKLALIPSGYKASTVYSALPINGDGDFKFSRTSNATRVNKDGLIESVGSNVPRLDYLDSNCPSLLLEPQRTNLIPYSEDFTNWTASGVTITPNAIISPKGTLNASKLVSTANNWNIVRYFSVTSGIEYTASIYAKLDTSTSTTTTRLSIFDGTSSLSAFYNLSNETISNSGFTSTFIEYLGNDWYRIGATYTSTGTSNGFFIYPSQDYGIAGTMYFWGAQIEEGSYPTSYIPTDGSAETRTFEDLESINTYTTGNDVTWFLDFNTYSFENSFRPLFVIRNAGFTQTMDFITYNSGSDYYFRARVTNQSTLQTIIAYGQNAIQMFTRNKLAIRLYGSNFEIYVNGVREYTGTSTDGDWTILNNSSLLNDFGGSTERPSAKISDFRIYNQTMTQSELEQLTTL